jgi:hypothetical protein
MGPGQQEGHEGRIDASGLKLIAELESEGVL